MIVREVTKNSSIAVHTHLAVLHMPVVGERRCFYPLFRHGVCYEDGMYPREDLCDRQPGGHHVAIVGNRVDRRPGEQTTNCEGHALPMMVCHSASSTMMRKRIDTNMVLRS